MATSSSELNPSASAAATHTRAAGSLAARRRRGRERGGSVRVRAARARHVRVRQHQRPPGVRTRRGRSWQRAKLPVQLNTSADLSAAEHGFYEAPLVELGQPGHLLMLGRGASGWLGSALVEALLEQVASSCAAIAWSAEQHYGEQREQFPGSCFVVSAACSVRFPTGPERELHGVAPPAAQEYWARA